MNVLVLFLEQCYADFVKHGDRKKKKTRTRTMLLLLDNKSTFSNKQNPFVFNLRFEVFSAGHLEGTNAHPASKP